MAGGVKKPVNIFRLKNIGEPDGVLNNWRLWFAVVSFGLLGAARGIDEGLISGAFNSPSFKERINFASYSKSEQADLKGNVSSMVPIGSVLGALTAFVLCDRLGRINTTRVLCCFWMVGIAIAIIGGSRSNLGGIYAGRFIAGIGVGMTPVVGPVYLAEISPAAIRGICTCFFTGAVYLGIVLAYFANYGAQVHINPESDTRWQIPFSLHIMMAGIIFILMFFQLESPRFLIKIGKHEQAAHVLSKLRGQPPDSAYVNHEFSAIQDAIEREAEAAGQSFLSKLRELFLIPSNFYRVYLGIMVQLLGQFSGAGSITIYANDLFGIIGITGTETGLLVTAVFGIVKLVAALSCALFLVDVIGRKRSLLLGIALQAISVIYVASFLTAFPKLGTAKNYVLPDSGKPASKAAIAAIFISGCGWALGFNSMQYLLTAELFPLNIRALATSFLMTLHFFAQWGSARSVPNMLLSVQEGGITPGGTFFCFAAITILAWIWTLFSIPETAGISLEDMDRLFELPWYQIGLKGRAFADRQDAARDMDEKREAEIHVSNHYLEKNASNRQV
ncbi:hypothetical protein HIM_01168 [Hirsutella minnesotensis 3608]|nr:hypothetical protein HIM_01168 [Hirsutella minnesotensis 3608]